MVEFKDGRIVNDPDEDTDYIPDGLYYSAKEFAELLDIPEATVRVWKNRGVLDCISYYGRTYIPEKFRLKLKRRVTEEG